MTQGELKNLLKARAVPYLISKGLGRAEAENYVEAMWLADPNVVRIETKLGLHRAN